MAPSFGTFVPDDDAVDPNDQTSTHTPLVVSSVPTSSLTGLPRHNAEAAATHRRGLAKVGGLILFATAAAAVYIGGSGGEQPDPISGGTSAVLATGLKHQQTSGVAYSETGNTFLDAATGSVMEVEASSGSGGGTESGGSTNLAVALDNGGKGHSGDWVNQHGNGAPPKLWPDSDNFDPRQGQSSSRKTGDGSGTSHSKAYENQEEHQDEEEAKEEVSSDARASHGA